MTQQQVLITGGYGCIGAETAKWLLAHCDVDVTLCSRSVSRARTDQVFSGVDATRLEVIEADVTDQSALRQILEEQAITRVVHLAALQTPDCNANRDLGLQINLAGTQFLIEAMKACGRKLERFVFASSIAVYGPRAVYPDGLVPMSVQPQPVNVYGAWKLAGEHISRYFCEDTGTPTVSLRPGVLYGPGRDAGLTSTPTTAMKCVAFGKSYQIPFRSTQDYLYAPDVGAAFGLATMDPFEGYGVFTLPSRTLNTEQIVAEMKAAADELGLSGKFDITIGSDEVPFICELDFQPFLDVFPTAPCTPLADAIRQTLVVFQKQVESGQLTTEDL